MTHTAAARGRAGGAFGATLGLIVLLLAASQGTGRAASTTVRYTLGASPILVCNTNTFGPGAFLPRSIGGGCFALSPGDSQLSVTITDARFSQVAGRITFTDANENEDPFTVPFCGSVAAVPIPPGSQGFTVLPGIYRTLGQCGGRSATQGRITASVS